MLAFQGSDAQLDGRYAVGHLSGASLLPPPCSVLYRCGILPSYHAVFLAIDPQRHLFRGPGVGRLREEPFGEHKINNYMIICNS